MARTITAEVAGAGITAALGAALLSALITGPADTRNLADRMGVPVHLADAVLTCLAWDGHVDAHEPPQPCGREAMRWFLIRGGQ